MKFELGIAKFQNSSNNFSANQKLQIFILLGVFKGGEAGGAGGEQEMTRLFFIRGFGGKPYLRFVVENRHTFLSVM